MIRLSGLISQKAFGKFEMGKVISNPFANAFIKEGEGEDHEVSMANNSIDTIIKMATELKAKMGEDEKQIPAWIQDHIAKAENLISQASGNYHEYGDSNESVNEAIKENDWKTIYNAFVKFLKANTKALEIRVMMRDEDATKKAIKSIISGLTNAQRSLKLESVIKEKSYPSFADPLEGFPTEYKELLKKLQRSNNPDERTKLIDKMNIIRKNIKLKPLTNESVNEACWDGYKQVGMKDKGGRQVPNCVPNESVVNEEPAKSTGEKIQNLNNRIKALKDKMAATKSSEGKNLIQQRLKNALQTLSNYKKQNISKESVNEGEGTINEDSETKRLEMLIKNLEETNKLLVQQLKDNKSLSNNKKENIKKSIYYNLDLINYYKKWLKDYQALANESLVNEEGPCWKGYKQVGTKNKGGRQVPNCVPNK